MRRPHDWFMQAEADMEMARQAREAGRFDWACFAAQQAAEKAVKALHESVGTEAWGHSVAALLQGLDDPVPEEVIEAAKALDKHYVAARYPNAHQMGAPADLYTGLDADRALGDANRVIDHVRGNLPQA